MFMINKLSLFLIFLLGSIALQAQVSFVVESLPSSTPEEDSIFIVGTFNNWKTNDPRYMLRPLMNGKYEVTLKIDTGTIEYKFGRGNWTKVETDEHNSLTKNRVYKAGSGKVVLVTIKNWLDLGGGKHLNYVVFYLFAIACYILGLFIYFSTLHHRSRNVSNAFILFNASLALSLICGIAFNLTDLIWQTKILSMGYILLCAWGPALRFFLLSIQDRQLKHKLWINFLPVSLIALWTVLQFFDFSALLFLSHRLHSDLTVGNELKMLICLATGLFHHIRMAKELDFATRSDRVGEGRNFVTIVFFISALSFVLFCLHSLLLTLGKGLPFVRMESLTILLSPISVVEFYFFWRYPSLLNPIALQEKNEEKEELQARIPSAGPDASKERTGLINVNTQELTQKLETLMVQRQPYRNPDLSIAELSEMLKTKSHVLSKLLNEHYNKNFRDFINEYRINEFIRISTSDSNKNFTFLALAYEVGFNSKSTFNLAFKKSKGLSPRDFFKLNYSIVDSDEEL